MAFDTDDKLNSNSNQKNLEEFGIWISKEPEDIENFDTAQASISEATDSFNFVEANFMPFEENLKENQNNFPENFENTQNEEEIDLSQEFGIEKEENFKPSDELNDLNESDFEKNQFNSIDFDELDDNFSKNSSVPSDFNQIYGTNDEIQDETFTLDKISPSPDFNLEDATPLQIIKETPPRPVFDLASPVETETNDFENSPKIEKIESAEDFENSNSTGQIEKSGENEDFSDFSKNIENAENAQNIESNFESSPSLENIENAPNFKSDLKNENIQNIENFASENENAKFCNFEIENIAEMPAELSTLNCENDKIENCSKLSQFEEIDAKNNFECPNNCIECEEIDLPNIENIQSSPNAENIESFQNIADFEKLADAENLPNIENEQNSFNMNGESETENIQNLQNSPLDFSNNSNAENISLDGFADFDISAFENNDFSSPKSNASETEVSLDNFLGESEDVSAQFGLSDGGFDVTDDFLAELNGEFGGKEEKSDILDEDSVDIELEFDDAYIDDIQLNASDRIEDTSNFDEFFGDDAGEVNADNFDELFANVKDESATDDFEKMFADANDVSSLPKASDETSQNATQFDEVTEFDDILFSDDGPNIEAEKAHANKINAQIDYNISVAEEDVKITPLSQKIESDTGDDENIAIFGTTIDENGAKIAMQQPLEDNGIRGPALDNSEDDSFYETLFNDAENYDANSSNSSLSSNENKKASDEDLLFNELADLGVNIEGNSENLNNSIENLGEKNEENATKNEDFLQNGENKDFLGENIEKKTDANTISEQAETNYFSSLNEMSFDDLMPKESMDFLADNEKMASEENLAETKNFDDNIEENNEKNGFIDAQNVPSEEILENAGKIENFNAEEIMGNEENFEKLGENGEMSNFVNNEKNEKIGETQNAESADELLDDDLPVFGDIEDFTNSENEEIEKIELIEDFENENLSNSTSVMEQFDDFGEFPNNETNETVENSIETINEPIIEDAAFDDILSDTDVEDFSATEVASDLGEIENIEQPEQAEQTEDFSASEDFEQAEQAEYSPDFAENAETEVSTNLGEDFSTTEEIEEPSDILENNDFETLPEIEEQNNISISEPAEKFEETSDFENIEEPTDVSATEVASDLGEIENIEQPEQAEQTEDFENAEQAEDFSADEEQNDFENIEENDEGDGFVQLSEDSFRNALPDTAITAGIANGIFDDILNEEESSVQTEIYEELPVFERIEDEEKEISEIQDLSFDEESEDAPLELTEDFFKTALPDTPISAGLTENLVNNNLLDNKQESKYTETMEDEQNMNFDDISQTSEENAKSAEINENAVLSAISSEPVLKQISNELSMLRNEISLLKTELAKTRESVKAESVVENVAVEPVQEPVEESVIEDDLTVNEEIVSDEATVEEQIENSENVDDIIPEPVASNGFFDNDTDDETIALSDDELGNILNCADFTEEYIDNTEEVEAEQHSIPESVAALHAEVDEAYNNDSENVADPVIGEVQFEDEPFDSVPDEIEVPKVDDLVTEENTEPTDDFVDTADEEISSDSISDEKLAYLQEDSALNEVSVPEMEEIAEENEAISENEIEIPSFEESAESEGEEIAENAETENAEESEETEQAEPGEVSENISDVADISTEENESDEIVVEEPSEEIVIDSENELTVEPVVSSEPNEQIEVAESDENISDNTIEIGTDETENDFAENGTFAEPEETPVETVFDGDQWDEPAEETSEIEENSTTEEIAETDATETVEEEARESIFDKASAIADKEPMNTDLKDEIKSVLVYMDQLLENLPDEKIEEFAKSSYFETYKKLFKELGLS